MYSFSFENQGFISLFRFHAAPLATAQDIPLDLFASLTCHTKLLPFFLSLSFLEAWLTS